MAYDKAVDSGALDAALGGIADAIRGKTGGTEKLTLDQMAAAIAGIEIGGTSGRLLLGDCELMFGQFTPTETGSFEIPIPAELSRITRYATVRIADASVVAEKYSTANIMLESHFAIGDNSKEIHYASNGVTYSVLKTAFGLRDGLSSRKALYYEAHANWPGQPETYNWIALLEV